VCFLRAATSSQGRAHPAFIADPLRRVRAAYAGRRGKWGGKQSGEIGGDGVRRVRVLESRNDGRLASGKAGDMGPTTGDWLGRYSYICGDIAATFLGSGTGRGRARASRIAAARTGIRSRCTDQDVRPLTAKEAG
jgi:hypothetical protein